VTDAAVFAETRADLIERRRLGLDGGMQFTYRNPERSTDPGRILVGAKALVVGAWSYRREEPPPAPDRGRSPWAPRRPTGHVARYARQDHYGALRSALAPIADHLEGLGWRTAVVCDDNALVDRAAAHRAGLGWFGKNSLMLVDGIGSWFVLGSVITDAPLRLTAPDGPRPHAAGCGSCSRCMTACPTQALVAPGVLDARRCLAWLVQAPGSFPEEHRQALGDRIYGCDECQQVCPINRLADRRDPPPPPGPGSEASVDLLGLLEASDEDLLVTHGRWYIPARDPRYLRRNALVALGNVGDGADESTERALRHWLGADDPMLVEHARWAARRLGRDDLVEPAR
jgi:epoxyqueuosine reductase